jgi:hypothetical protein
MVRRATGSDLIEKEVEALARVGAELRRVALTLPDDSDIRAHLLRAATGYLVVGIGVGGPSVELVEEPA